MGDFGHIAASFGSTHIDAWGAGPFNITVGGKRYFFEDSDRFGPFFVGRRNHDVLETQPGSRHPFWPAHYMWVKGGRKVEAGECIYERPMPGQYWKDARGISHFLRDPDHERLGFVQVPKPATAQ